MGQHYKEIAAIALKRRESAIPKEYLLPESVLKNLPLDLTTIPRDSGHFAASELEIIETAPEDILSKIREKKWTSVAVTKAFCKAAVVAQQLVCFHFFLRLITKRMIFGSRDLYRQTASQRSCSLKLSRGQDSSTNISREQGSPLVPFMASLSP
jgi:hypothetical protein